MPFSSRMTWPFPAEGQDPWFDAFRSMILAQDASGFASREDRSIIFMEGGNICFDSITGILSWSSSIEILAPITGFRWSVPAGSVTLQEGQLAYISLVRAPTQNTTVSIKAAAQVPSNDVAIIFCVRRLDQIYFRTGDVLVSGPCFPVISDPGRRYIDVIPHPKDVLGTLETIVGSVYLKGSSIISARAMIGSQAVGDTATLNIRHTSDATLLATLGGVAGFLTERSLSDVTISEGWFDLLLFSDNIGGKAICNGVFFEVR